MVYDMKDLAFNGCSVIRLFVAKAGPARAVRKSRKTCLQPLSYDFNTAFVI
jgi:hypothetical protein